MGRAREVAALLDTPQNYSRDPSEFSIRTASNTVNLLLVSEPGFWVFWPQIPLKTNVYIKQTCWEWSEQLDIVDMDHFGLGIWQNHQRFVRK